VKTPDWAFSKRKINRLQAGIGLKNRAFTQSLMSLCLGSGYLQVLEYIRSREHVIRGGHNKEVGRASAIRHHVPKSAKAIDLSLFDTPRAVW
jgi:hypothetical protein